MGVEHGVAAKFFLFTHPSRNEGDYYAYYELSLLLIPMITTTLLSIALSISALLPQAKEPTDPDRYASKHKTSQQLLEAMEALEFHGFSGAVLAAVDGEVRIACGIGMADMDGKSHNTANTLFELASLTKQFTAAAICTLHDQKLLKLDDRISDHLPNVPKDCKKITIRHLLQHTSGIPGSNSQGGGFDLEALVPVFLEGGPQHKVGKHWEYWNQGYALLAGIIERTAGKNFATYCTETLFRLNGMRTACFTGDPLPKGMTEATGRGRSGRPRLALEHPYGAFGFQYQGMGGAVSNVWDLWRWHLALQGEEMLNKKTKQQLFKPGLNDYALGWRVNKRGALTVQFHSGSVRGFVCEMRRYPKVNGCIILLCNDDSIYPGTVASVLEKAILEDEIPPIILPLDAEMQSLVVGHYIGSGGAEADITADGAMTKARLTWRESVTSPGSLGLNEDGELQFLANFEAVKTKTKFNSKGKLIEFQCGETTFKRK
jgi:CubicO group peptidase (beta-lactamase class C family)